MCLFVVLFFAFCIFGCLYAFAILRRYFLVMFFSSFLGDFLSLSLFDFEVLCVVLFFICVRTLESAFTLLSFMVLCVCVCLEGFRFLLF